MGISSQEAVSLEETKQEELVENETKDVVVSETTDKEIMEQYFNDEKVKENLDTHAVHFNEASHGNWFTLERIVKKSRIKKPIDAKMILDLLVMSKRAFAKKDGEEIKYKITLSSESRKKVIENQIKELKFATENLQKELEELSK